MRYRVRFPVLPQGFLLKGEDSHGDHGLGSSVELRFKTPPGTLIKTDKLLLYRGKFALCPEIQNKHINAVWAEHRISEC
jgi:hypothetical protein